MEAATVGAWLTSSTPLRRPWERLVAIGAPRILLVSAMAVTFGAFALAVQWRHDRFATFDHDLAIWDQSIWLLANGEGFNTVRGLAVFGFHVSPALYLLVPFYWLGAGPNFLNVTMVAALVAGAAPVFAAALHHLRNEWHALVVAVAFLVNYAGQWMMHETFHPEVMAITPMLFAYLASRRGQWLRYGLWLALAVAWKEDVAMAAFMLGFLLWWRRETRVGVLTMAASALWLLLATQVVIPAFSPEGNFTEGLYGDLGSSAPEIVVTSLAKPGRVAEHLEQADAPRYLSDLSSSLGFVPLLAPGALLIGLPQALANLLAVHEFFWTTKVHYAAMPLVAAAIATIEGVARARRAALRRFLLGAIAVGAFYTAVAWGAGPASPAWEMGYWPLDPNPRAAALEAALEHPAPEDAVAASYNLVPHLSHRSEVYTFPNPWQLQNWGVRGENPPNPDTVDWILVDTATLSEEHARLLEGVLAGDGGGGWEVVSEDGAVLVARRAG